MYRLPIARSASAARRARRRRAGSGRGLRAALLVAVLGAVTVACRGGDDTGAAAAPPGPGATAPPSRDDFVREANDVCDDFNRQMATIGDQLGDDASVDDLVDAYRDKALPALRDTVARIRAIGFPAGDDAALRVLFGDLDAAIDRVQADPEKELQASNDPFESVNQRLDGYGLDHCAP